MFRLVNSFNNKYLRVYQSGVTRNKDARGIEQKILECMVLETNGDKNMEGGDVKEILNKFENLTLQTNINYSDFKEMDGEKISPSIFIKQFEPFLIEWGEEKTLKVLANKLVGQAKNWYKGKIIDNEISCFKKFKDAFFDFFEETTNEQYTKILEKIVHGYR